jgi:DNA-binding MarR family transcriptional regulator
MPELTKSHFETLAAWRYALRTFLRFSQEAAKAAGLPAQQHQVLLVIKGWRGRDYVTVGEIASRMQLKHHSAVGLVDRMVLRQLVQRTASKSDRRRIEVRLTPKGEALISRLSAIHLEELRQLRPELQRLVATLGTDGGSAEGSAGAGGSG